MVARLASEKDEILLQDVLNELAKKAGTGYNLRLRWVPTENSDKAGEIISDILYVYSKSRDEAEKIVQHEFMDWLVVQAIAPYQDVINLQRTVMNSIFRYLQDSAYNKKEIVIESLLKLMEADPDE